MNVTCDFEEDVEYGRFIKGKIAQYKIDLSSELLLIE